MYEEILCFRFPLPRPKRLILIFLINMASCSTSLSSSTPLSSSLLPEMLSKQRPFEFSRHDTSFSEGNPLDDGYVYNDFKRVAAKDEKLRELVPHFEALKRAQSYMKMFLHAHAKEIRESLEGKDEDDENQKMGLVTFTLLVPSTKAELIKLEDRSFIFKLWLRRLEIIKEVDMGRFLNLQDFVNAIHNAQEVIKSFRNFIRHEKYNNEELKDMFLYYKDLLKKSSIKVLQEKEKAGFEMEAEDFIRFHCHKARLCALLGLKLDFLDRLDEMSPEHRHHRTLSDWIVTFLENNIESVTKEHVRSLSKEALASIGFDPLSAAVETIIARSFDGSAQHHIETCEWAEIFIKDEFKYNPLLSSMNAKFPFYSDLTNAWFQLPSIVESKNNNDDFCNVNIMNLLTKESQASRMTQTVLNDFVSQDDQNIVLYHGTDHLSAADILVRGIDLCAGRQKRDFSCGSGFYLTNSFDSALDWAKSTTAKPAILVFKVNMEDLDGARKLSLNNNEERWRKIVSSFRSGSRTARTRKSLSSYDFIEGPMASVTRSETSDELLIEQKRSSYQMCLNSDDFAEEFQQTLHSVIFLDISL